MGRRDGEGEGARLWSVFVARVGAGWVPLHMLAVRLQISNGLDFGAVRVLLDTNIVIHREAASVVREDIGVLFRWLDKLGHEKCVHPHTIDEIAKHGDPKVVRSFGAKL